MPEGFRRLLARLWHDDLDAVREGLPAALGYPGVASEEEKDFIRDYVLYMWRPVRTDAPFCYDEHYTKEVFRRTYSGVRLGAKVALKKGYPDTETRGLALLNRLQFGFASILGGLRAEANWHRQFRGYFTDAEWKALDPEWSLPPL